MSTARILCLPTRRRPSSTDSAATTRSTALNSRPTIWPRLAYDGAKKRYGDPLPDNVKEHINFELHVMKTMGFPGYFLIVQDFINAARNDLGVWVTGTWLCRRFCCRLLSGYHQDRPAEIRLAV